MDWGVPGWVDWVLMIGALIACGTVMALIQRGRRSDGIDWMLFGSSLTVLALAFALIFRAIW